MAPGIAGKRLPLNAAQKRRAAERTRRAKVISALGEEQAAQTLVDAARILQPVPQAMQLRYLTALFDISGERTSTIVFPVPIDLFQNWKAFTGSAREDT